MIAITVTLACCLAFSTALGFYWAFLNFQRLKGNRLIAAELDQLVQTTLGAIKKNEKLARSSVPDNLNDLYNSAVGEKNTDLTHPALLSSILTVIIKKYGDVKLALSDFMIPDEEYVSVYMDTHTKQLILSMNHGLERDVPYTLAAFTDPDDNTFH